MKQISYDEKLKKEKEKLERLVNNALKNGVPLAQDEAVMAQSRKIDILVLSARKTSPWY